MDLGCGIGREAVFLASLGWQVLALDVLPDALQRARLFASRYPQVADLIQWEAKDVEDSLPTLGEFDLVTMFYFLDRGAVSLAASQLKSGASLIVETFTQTHRDRFGKPHSDSRVLQLGELETLIQGFDIEHASEEWRSSGRHTARLWARKP
jgi:2-polyprenyl-3-methyl-5-hydroxy-6-metoxy-1,4-benzoquinol methylase